MILLIILLFIKVVNSHECETGYFGNFCEFKCDYGYENNEHEYHKNEIINNQNCHYYCIDNYKIINCSIPICKSIYVFMEKITFMNELYPCLEIVEHIEETNIKETNICNLIDLINIFILIIDNILSVFYSLFIDNILSGFYSLFIFNGILLIIIIFNVISPKNFENLLIYIISN